MMDEYDFVKELLRVKSCVSCGFVRRVDLENQKCEPCTHKEALEKKLGREPTHEEIEESLFQNSPLSPFLTLI